MTERAALPEGMTWSETEDGFSLTAALACPMSEARSLAVIAASWVREAAGGGGAKILWPNHAVLEGRRLCGITCRGTARGVVFTFTPDYAAIPVPPETFRARLREEAVSALSDYPGNQPALMQRYCEHCLTVMKFVRTAYRGLPVYGFAFAVDRHGGLMVMTQESHTVITLYGGAAEIVRKDEEPDEPPELPVMPGR